MKEQKIWRFGLIGQPLEHSYSPILHQTALVDAGLTGTYQLFPLESAEMIPAMLEKVRTGELDGLNVTIPYKQAVMPHLDALTGAAQAIGAVNTIYLKEGHLVGDNTDAPGFWQDLSAHLQGVNLFAEHALILGAGGAARALAYELTMQGWQVTVAARRKAQTMSMLENLSLPMVKAAHWEALQNPAFLNNFALLVNATPVGMFPDVKTSPLPEDLKLPGHLVVYDLIYNPRESLLLQQAKTAGCIHVNGLGMLIEQAAIAFERWTGIKPDTGRMARALAQKLDGEAQS